MKDKIRSGFSDRLTAQADARKAMLAKFKPKPTVVATNFKSREEERAEEREARRLAREAEKEAARLAAIAAAEAALEARKSDRKERKANEKAEQRARKSSRYANLEALGELRLGVGSSNSTPQDPS